MPTGPAHTIARLARAVDRWIDAPASRQPSPLFLAGTDADGIAPVAMRLDRSPACWTHGTTTPALYADRRLADPAAVEAVLRLTPADRVVLPVPHDSHLLDQMLEAHASARAIWLVRDWRRAAAAEVRLHGTTAKECLLDLADGTVRDPRTAWFHERVPDEVKAVVADLAHPELAPEAAAALAWYVRHSFLHALGLADDPRVLVVRADELDQDPATGWARVFAFAEAGMDPSWATEGTGAADPAWEGTTPSALVRLCDALQDALDDALGGT